MKQIFSGAEAVSYDVCAKLRELNPATEVFIGYGATERPSGGTIGSFEPDALNRGTLPVGRPLPNYRLYVVDDADGLCPIRVVGHILMGGELLSPGYLNLQLLTETKFVSDPFVQIDCARVYRTGDMGRWLLDGQLEFCGRVDNQIKLRGVRVKLGEVEAVFRAVSNAERANSTGRCNISKFGDVKWGDRGAGARNKPGGHRRARQVSISLRRSKRSGNLLPREWKVTLRRVPIIGSAMVSRSRRHAAD